jgi:NTE family protein
MTKGAVVFAGGGLAGIAWETGVLVGIRDEQPQAYERIVDAATTFVGTSAGSAVAAQVAGGTPLDDLYAAQLSPETAEIGADVDLAEFMATMGAALEGASSPEESLQRIGAIALAADTVPAADRRAAIAARLPNKSWSTRRVLLPAIDTATGMRRVFDRESGVDLVDAVAASCAVPGIWPTVLIDGARYMDGGMGTISNADLAAGAEQVLILVPGLPEGFNGPAITQAELDALAPARILSVYADDSSIAAFGSNPLDPSIRKPSALAGAEVGRRFAAQVAEFWS